jgi:2,3-bisphosphoglycerate-dependent phosphoglycerate mutase
MQLYFVRHGESEANVRRVISNRDWIHPLTDTGRRQAQALARRLLPVGAGKIYSSPIRRAVETADILAQNLQLPVEIVDALREYDCGLLEGKSDDESWRLHAELKRRWLVDLDLDCRITGGESYIDIQKRFKPFIRELVDDESRRNESVILVGHGGTYQCMLPDICENLETAAALEYPFPNTGYVHVSNKPQGLMCLEWCGTKVN